MDLREIGLLFYLAASSATVAETLEHLAEYAATTTDEIRLEISQQQNESLLILPAALVADAPCRQHSEFTALSFNRVLHKLTNRDFSPSRVGFAHARDSGLRTVHRTLRYPFA